MSTINLHPDLMVGNVSHNFPLGSLETVFLWSVNLFMCVVFVCRVSNDASFKHWLDGPCLYLPCSNRPTPIINNMLHVGNQCVHYTHTLAVHRGLVYCSKCGSRKGANHLKKLAYTCEPPSEYGKMNLKAIAEDKLPPNLDEWPSQGSSHVLEPIVRTRARSI